MSAEDELFMVAKKGYIHFFTSASNVEERHL